MCDQAVIRDRSKNSFTKKVFNATAMDMLKDHYKSTDRDPTSCAKVSSSSLYRLRRDVAPDTLERGRSQNQRRLDAITDIRNHVCLAALWKAVLASIANKVVEVPSRLFNFDATSILLEAGNDDAVRLYMAEGSRA